MSSEILLELPDITDKIISPFIEGGPLIFCFQYKLIIMNVQDGCVIKTFDFSKQRKKILDCTYNVKNGLLVVIFEGSSSTTISDQFEDTANAKFNIWPHQPLRIVSLEDSGYAFLCEHGVIYQAFVAQNDDIVIGKRASDLMMTPVYVASCYTQSCLVAAAPSSEGGGSLDIFCWRIMSQVDVTNTNLLSQKHARIFTTSVKKDETLYFMCGHPGRECVSLFLVDSLGRTRWLKLGLDGRTLFSKELCGTELISHPFQITSLDNKMFVVYDDMVVMFCHTYGVEISRLRLQHRLSGLSSDWLPKRQCAAWGANQHIVSLCRLSSDYWLWYCAPGIAGGQTLKRIHICFDLCSSTPATLMSALGRVCGDFDYTAQLSPAGAGDGSQGILQALSTAERRRITDVEAAIKAQENLSVSDGDQSTLLGKRRRIRSYMDVPVVAIEAFLGQFIFAGSESCVLTSSDWGTLQMLLRTRTISLARYPLLLDMVIVAKRLEVMVDLTCYAPDLSERDAVLMLKVAAAFPQTAMSSYTFHDGSGSKRRLQYTPSDRNVKELNSSKKRKTKEKQIMNLGEPLPNDTSSPLLALILTMESVLMRTGAFSAMALVDAVRPVSADFSALLLRVLVHIVQNGCCLRESNALDSQLLVSSDDILDRAVTWMEALLDAHFSALALNMSCHIATRRSLFCAMNLVSSVGMAVPELEGILGLCAHIRRQVVSGLDLSNKQYSVYVTETLSL